MCASYTSFKPSELHIKKKDLEGLSHLLDADPVFFCVFSERIFKSPLETLRQLSIYVRIDDSDLGYRL
jgi:hypothetical protein